MQFFVISDNIDTQIGMRLTGINGVVVHEAAEAVAALREAADNKDVAIILMTKKIIKLCNDTVFDFKLNRKRPLIVEIPDRHATSQLSDTISRYVEEAIGVKL